MDTDLYLKLDKRELVCLIEKMSEELIAKDNIISEYKSEIASLESRLKMLDDILVFNSDDGNSVKRELNFNNLIALEALGLNDDDDELY
ncbi:MAG: hypothetical protein PT956_04290 [Firmicutes bacterium]|nr:hypothetical protein [Ezakiella sp.]MDD7761864.1 hypothetical protein [Bacillota bacterium]